MAIVFRMPYNFLYPNSIKDINFCIRWLRKNVKQFYILPASIGLLGTSSGGHQAILNALIPSNPNFLDAELEYPTVDPTVGHVIACWPVLDPSARYEMVLNRRIQRLIDAHHAFWPSIEMMSEGNPQKII
jgi:acetyl esterase/lipase